MLELATRPAQIECLSVGDTARVLGCSTRTVLRLIQSGRLRRIQRGFGRETWVPVVDIRRVNSSPEGLQVTRADLATAV